MSKISKLFKVGMEAPEAFAALIRGHPEIKRVTFLEYCKPDKGVENTLEDGGAVSLGRMLSHESYKVKISLTLKRKDISGSRIRELAKRAGENGRALAFFSKISVSRGHLHIPIMDFKCEVSESNLRTIKLFLKATKENGLILNSGRSYHFYGFNLLSDKNWLEFMARCLLLHGFTDDRYIGHKLIDGGSILRLAKIEGSDRYLMTPKVIAIVD